MKTFILLFCWSLSAVKAQGIQGCKDIHPACQQNLQLCNNELYRSYMMRNCRRSCGVCSGAPVNGGCLLRNGGCEHFCSIVSDEVKCSCRDGYKLNEDGVSCDDVDECIKPNNPCDGKAHAPYCVNMRGTYHCTPVSCRQMFPGLTNRYKSNDCCRESPDDFRCPGDLAGRILGGRSALKGTWPWMVYIEVTIHHQKSFCGGTLIHESWVLTAAHCFKSMTNDSTVTLDLGRMKPTSHLTEEPTIQRRTANQIVYYPNWDKIRYPYNDIAIVHLNMPIRITSDIYPACLPNGERPEPGTTCWVTGYGTTAFHGRIAESLQEVRMPIRSDDECERAYSRTKFPIDRSVMFCAGHDEGGKDACQGDSGGPLICQRCSSCSWFLYGITSFGKKCGLPGYYGVFTDVEAHEEWISRETGIIINKNHTCTSAVTSTWGHWNAWTECSKSCDRGKRSRTRACVDNVGSVSNSCHGGRGTHTMTCNDFACTSWGAWDQWNECSVACGGGERNRRRRCMYGSVGDPGCDIGMNEQRHTCNTLGCDGDWSSWAWPQPCSASCGGGVRRAVRSCLSTDGVCVGEAHKPTTCNSQPCQTVSAWAEWSECSSTCGNGQSTRRRRCLAGDCTDTLQETRECTQQRCRGVWAEWSEFGACTASCGKGSQTRVRDCQGGTAGEYGCEGVGVDRRNCFTSSCSEPIGISWNTWNEWSSCSATCNGGERRRQRGCEGGQVGDVGCSPVDAVTQSEVCNQSPCRDECVDRDGRCVFWVKIYPQYCNTHPVFMALKCQKSCKIYCRDAEPWQSWSACTRTCGGGRQIRERHCLKANNCHHSTRQTRACGNVECSGYSQWTAWGDCSATCGGGSQMRTRQCSLTSCEPDSFGQETSQAAECGTETCPGFWNEWGAWGECDSSCGGGSRLRERMCVGDGGCDGASKHNQVCNTNSCPASSGRCTGIRDIGTINCSAYLRHCATNAVVQRHCQRSCCRILGSVCTNLYSDAQCDYFLISGFCPKPLADRNPCKKHCGLCS